MAVALFPRPDKLHLHALPLHLRRPEIAEYGQVGLAPQLLLELGGKADAAAHHYYVDVIRRAFEEKVAHVAAHYVALKAELVGCS